MGLGVGLIGSGYMGKCHALAWTSAATVFPDVERPRLVALADASPELAQQQAQTFGFGRGTGDWRDLVADPAIDVISIAAPNQFHAEMAVAALEAGKHVWCEKPMATSLENATRMRDAASRSGRTAILGYNYIQNPMIRLARAIIDEGRIGTVNHIRLEMDEDYMADPTERFYWKSEKAQAMARSMTSRFTRSRCCLFSMVGSPRSLQTWRNRMPNVQRTTAAHALSRTMISPKRFSEQKLAPRACSWSIVPHGAGRVELRCRSLARRDQFSSTKSA